MFTARQQRFIHAGAVICAGLVCLGCLASTYRSARVMKGGQASIGAGYLKPFPLGEEESNTHYGSIDLRMGTGAGFDLGAMYSTDLGDGDVPTVWGDVRFQATNRDNEVGKPILTFGLGKGYVMMEDGSHITRLPVQLGIPISHGAITTLTYQGDWLSDDFLPFDGESGSSLRSTFTLGAEIDMIKRENNKWVPKIGIGIGYLTGEDWDEAIMLNVGISVDSPFTP